MRLSEEEHAGRGIGKRQGPGVRMGLVCLNSSRETGEAGVEGSRVSPGEMKFQGWVLAGSGRVGRLDLL